MLVERATHLDRPHEIAVYLSASLFGRLSAREGVNNLQDLDEPGQRRLCYIFGKQYPQDRPQRKTYESPEGMTFDSNELGTDLVARLEPAEEPDLFDPQYVPVDLSIRILDVSGEQTLTECLETGGTLTDSKIEAALRAAELAVFFALRPPGAA